MTDDPSRPFARRTPCRPDRRLLLAWRRSPPPSTSAAVIPTFVPIGAGYAADTLEQFAAEAAAIDASGEVSILVLPITYGVDPLSMSNGLRNKNLTWRMGAAARSRTRAWW